MAKAQETVLEINLKNLEHNYNYLRSKLSRNTKLMAVVKAYAYGNDAITVAKHLEELNVDYFAVAYADEGAVLREAGIKTPILVLHPQAVNLENIIDYKLEPSIYSHNILDQFLELAHKKKLDDYPVHIKFNTGLNRLGFNKSDVDVLIKKIKSLSVIKIASLFSHLAASEDLNEKTFSENQITSFQEICEGIIKGLNKEPLIHMCNTSGVLNYPNAHFDMVRSGIGLYGFGNSEKEKKNFKPVATLKSIISQIHHINKGETVGYNRAYKSSQQERTATIPIGHADGISRFYGNKNGYVVINGNKAPIVGNVCMDMIMVNVSGIDCNEGDEVIFFNEEYTVEALAETINTISYELIAAISQRVKRLIIK